MSKLAISCVVVFLLTGCGDPDCPSGSMRTSEGRCIAVSDAGDAGDAGDASDAAMDGDTSPLDASDSGDPDAGCVPTGADDEPDPMHIDADCDGIDGELARSVFVATSGDDMNDGLTPEQPVETIARGLEIAETVGRRDVLLASGDYGEAVTLVDGVSLHGGYDHAASWQRTTVHARVSGPGPVVTGSMLANVRLSEIDVLADDAASGQSSIAVVLDDCTGVRFEDVSLQAGSGGNGAAGTIPSSAAAGGIVGGAAGRSAIPSSGCTFIPYFPEQGTRGPARCGCGQGGLGGRSRTALTEAPIDGTAGAACTAAGGGGGGDSRDLEFMGGAFGDDGDAGADGTNGGPGMPIGLFDGSGAYFPAGGGRGGGGQAGGGGGGGGAGGYCVTTSAPAGCLVRGGSGGGGGSGGCGGEAGGPGEGGGASIALVAVRSAVDLTDVTLVSARGGNGGRGGDGIAGGGGGMGGEGGATRSAGGCISGPGGRGGLGGNGGPGGAGGGGGGGPSIALALLDGSTVDAASTFTPMMGAGGNGGVAGSNGAGAAGTPGTDGMSLAMYTPPP